MTLMFAIGPAFALVAALGAGADWSTFRGDPAQRGVAPGELADDLVLRWRFETGAGIVSSPVIADGRVFIGSDDHHVHALDFETGEQLWSFPTEDMIEAPPMVADGVVYVGSSDFFFYAIDARTGALRWKRETGDKILGGAGWVPAREERAARVVVGSYDTRLYCFEANSGEPVWTYQTENYVNEIGRAHV